MILLSIFISRLYCDGFVQISDFGSYERMILLSVIFMSELYCTQVWCLFDDTASELTSNWLRIVMYSIWGQTFQSANVRYRSMTRISLEVESLNRLSIIACPHPLFSSHLLNHPPTCHLQSPSITLVPRLHSMAVHLCHQCY